MKTKKFNKKLVLNKNTIADLHSESMAKVHGGGPVTNASECPSHCIRTCPVGDTNCICIIKTLDNC